jgi:hypothetical protein
MTNGVLQPEETRTFIATLVPEVLTFYGKLIHPKDTSSSSPSGASLEETSPSISTSETESAPTPVKEDVKDHMAIFGSVSTKDILGKIKSALSADPDASRAGIEAHDLRFVDLEEGVDRVKTLGRWEVEISLGEDQEPIRRVVEVLPEEAVEE